MSAQVTRTTTTNINQHWQASFAKGLYQVCELKESSNAVILVKRKCFGQEEMRVYAFYGKECLTECYGCVSSCAFGTTDL
jgi:hypothetical protein